MRRVFSIQFELRHITRDAEDDWEIIEPEHISTWNEACRLIPGASYTHAQCEASVMIDWQPMVSRLAYLHDLRKTLYSASRSESFDWSPFLEPITLNGSVTIQGENELVEYDWYPGFFAELYAYELFAILNLSYPGSCNFLTLSIKVKGDRVALEPRLPGYPFDFARVETLAGRWPSLQVLPLRQVALWYSSLQLGTRQSAETSVEKLLFAMLHLSKRDDYAEAVIWIFYALETLVETRVGESVSTLVRRVSLLLGLDEKQKIALNKQLRKLYDLRSSIVHGGYRVTHPIAQEVVDRSVGDERSRAIDLFQFGFTIVVACLQALIARGWTHLSFQETMAGNDAKNG